MQTADQAQTFSSKTEFWPLFLYTEVHASSEDVL